MLLHIPLPVPPKNWKERDDDNVICSLTFLHTATISDHLSRLYYSFYPGTCNIKASNKRISFKIMFSLKKFFLNYYILNEEKYNMNFCIWINGILWEVENQWIIVRSGKSLPIFENEIKLKSNFDYFDKWNILLFSSRWL